MYIYTCVDIYMCIYIYICICIHNIYIYIYLYIHRPQRSPIDSAKEPRATCLDAQCSAHRPQKSPVYFAKEPCIFRKRALHIPYPEQTRHTPLAWLRDILPIVRKRALHILQKSPMYSISSAKQPYMYQKEPYVFHINRQRTGI